jgi:hypothetical protein
MGEYSEAFVGFDTSKTKHAVAIADGGRRGEVRFIGDVASSPATVERLVRKLAGDTPNCISVTKRGQPATDCTGRSGNSATTALSSRRR